MKTISYKGDIYVESASSEERPIEFKFNDASNLARNVISQLKLAQNEGDAARTERLTTSLRMAKKLVVLLTSLVGDA